MGQHIKNNQKKKSQRVGTTKLNRGNCRQGETRGKPSCVVRSKIQPKKKSGLHHCGQKGRPGRLAGAKGVGLFLKKNGKGIDHHPGESTEGRWDLSRVANQGGR